MNQKPQINKARRVLKGPESESNSLRLNKYLAKQGGFTRREADDLIREGKITVNGEVVSELGSKVKENDVILHNGKPLDSGTKYYVLLNKPKDTSLNSDDTSTGLTVQGLVKKACPEEIEAIGYLDNDTTGVLLLTNDKIVIKKISDSAGKKSVIYHIILKKDFLEEDLKTISKGIDIDGKLIKAKEVSYVDDTDKTQLGLEIMNNDSQVVLEIFKKLDYEIAKLDRVYFAGLTKKGLQRGYWRHLKKTEVASLKMGSYN